MEVLSSLTACPECNNVFRYYDYLSHIEICHHTIGNNNNNETNENNDYDGDSMDTEIDEDDTSSIINSNYNYNGINDYANYMGYINTNTTNTTNTTTSINNLSTYLSSININAGLDQGQLNNNSQQIECNTRTDCPVCLCSFPEKTLFYRLNCSHLFCIECCETWFKKHTNCPLCRNNYK